jgi:hypothetical protein
VFLLDRLKRRTLIGCRDSEGLGAAIETAKAFKERTFKVRGRGIRASHVPADEILRFVREEMPAYYTYATRVESYTDRREVPHACVTIKGWIGLSRQMNRYNPFDLTCIIETEAPASA